MPDPIFPPKTITYTLLGGYPTEPGYYLLISKETGDVFDHVMILDYPAKCEFGIEWPAYLGIPKWNGRHANNFTGWYYKMD